MADLSNKHGNHSAVNSSGESPRTHCLACKEPLLPGAKKCKECGTFQDWRRHVFLWSGIITALLAIVPAWGIGVSLWEMAFPANSDIRLKVTLCTSEQINVVAYNKGGRTGIVGRPKLWLVVDGKKEASALKVVPTSESFTIKPGDMLELEYQAMLRKNREDFPKKRGSDCRIILEFPIFGSEGETTTQEVDCPCN